MHGGGGGGGGGGIAGMLARSPSHQHNAPEGRDLDFAAAKAVQSIGTKTTASFFTRLMGVCMWVHACVAA